MISRRCSSLLAAAPFALATAALVSSVRADTLNWGTSGYTYNASQTGANATPGNVATINGNVISISYGNNSFFNNSSTAQPSPAVGTYTANTTTYTDGGTGAATGTSQSALQLFANFDNGANIVAGAGIPVTVFFSQPVSNLIFSFYDVDASTNATTPFTDYVTNIGGRNTSGTTIAPSSVLYRGTTTNGATTVTGTGSSAQNAADGNAAVTFGATPITQFTFTYTDTAATPGGAQHSTTQIIALSNLTFTTVPEPSTWAFFGAAGIAGAWALRRRARRTA